jgi:hypothetical protein
MLPGRYPVVAYPVTWSLSGAPAGVSIDATGLVCITAAAVLGDNNNITVNALYGGQTYTAALTITKAREGTPGQPGRNGDPGPQGERAATYLGTTATIPTGNVIVIVKGEKTGQVSAVPGDFALMTAAGLAWTRGLLRQWSGTAWVELVIESHVAEYMQAGLDLMEMSDLSGQTNSFPAIFTRLLFAMFIKVRAAITGGDRYNLDGTSKDTSKKGFWLGADGTFKAEKAEISGTINATDGVFKGTLEAKSVKIIYDVVAGDNYILRSNYDVSVPSRESPEERYTFMKSISTAARGTCRLVMKFKAVENSAGYDGKYKVFLNGKEIAVGDFADTVTVNINIPNTANQIEIWGWNFFIDGRPQQGYQTVLTAIELRVASDPGLLALLA